MLRIKLVFCCIQYISIPMNLKRVIVLTFCLHILMLEKMGKVTNNEC